MLHMYLSIYVSVHVMYVRMCVYVYVSYRYPCNLMQITCAVLSFARRSFKDCKQTWLLDVGRYGKGEK